MLHSYFFAKNDKSEFMAPSGALNINIPDCPSDQWEADLLSMHVKLIWRHGAKRAQILSSSHDLTAKRHITATMVASIQK